MLPPRILPRASVPDGLEVARWLTDHRRTDVVPTELSAETQAALHHLAALAALTLGAERGYVCLLHADRQVVVGRHGIAHGEYPIELGLNGETIATGEPLLVGDLLEDPIAQTNASVAVGVRAYAGAVVHLAGERVGVLCVLDAKPKAWTVGDAERLATLATLGDHLLEA